MSSGKNLLYTLGAIAAGAITGVLLAPKSGKETRKDILDKMSDLKDKSADAIQEGTSFAQETLSKASDILKQQQVTINKTKK